MVPVCGHRVQVALALGELSLNSRTPSPQRVGGAQIRDAVGLSTGKVWWTRRLQRRGEIRSCLAVCGGANASVICKQAVGVVLQACGPSKRIRYGIDGVGKSGVLVYQGRQLPDGVPVFVMRNSPS